MGHSEQFPKVVGARAGGAGAPFDAGIDGVLARMRALGGRWPRADGVGVFHRVYLTVTEEVGRQVDRGAFGDARAATVLDVCFAERYLRAVRAQETGGRPPACWQPLFESRNHPGVRPLQFALCGINAHIGHDLALAVVDACRALGCGPEALEDEFDRVGELLRALEERVREDLMPGPDLLELADPLTHLAGAWSLDRARDAAWGAARTLWALRGMPQVAREVRERLDAGVGMVGRMLLTPCGAPSRAADAWWAAARTAPYGLQSSGRSTGASSA